MFWNEYFQNLVRMASGGGGGNPEGQLHLRFVCGNQCCGSGSVGSGSVGSVPMFLGAPDPDPSHYFVWIRILFQSTSKKVRKPWFLLFCGLSWHFIHVTGVNVHSKSNTQKNNFFVGILQPTDEKSRIRIRTVSHGGDPKSDPYQMLRIHQHWCHCSSFAVCGMYRAVFTVLQPPLYFL